MVKFKIPCGWRVFHTTYGEIISFGGLGICDDCSTLHTEGGYLVPVLNHWMCQSCFDEWRFRTQFYPSDVCFEQINIDIYQEYLPVNKVLNSYEEFEIYLQEKGDEIC